MRILIYGTGGVGGYFGGKLALAGKDVTFVARGKHLEAINTQGLIVKSIAGDFAIHPAQATDQPHEPFDLIIISVKTWQVEEVAKKLSPLLMENTMVLPLQNGISAAEIVAKEIDRKHIIGGLCFISAKIEEYGVINHLAVEPLIQFGELDNRVSDRLAILKNLFEDAGIASKVIDDIDVALWKKFLFISSVGGIGALSRVPIGTTRSSHGTRNIMHQSMLEIMDIARAKGIELQEDLPDKTLAFIDSLPYDTKPSLQRDIMNGKPSELDALVGDVVKLGKRLDIDTPVNSFIFDCLIPMETNARL